MSTLAPHSFVYKLLGVRDLGMEGLPTDPKPLKPEQILVQSVASAVSPGTELAAWSGMAPLRPTQNPFPRLMGYCMVGQVSAVGSDGLVTVDGTTICPGDHILTHSAHRSYDVIQASDILSHVPAGANPVTASTTYLFHLGYSACLKANLTAGHRVAVIGLGTLGMTTGAVANMSGAQVDGFSNHGSQKGAMVFGISGFYRKTATPDQRSQYDIVVLTTNTWEDWMLAMNLARAGGHIVTIGFPGRGQDLPAYNPLGSEFVYDKQLTISACGYIPDLGVTEQDVRFTLKRNMGFLLSAVLSGRLPGAALVAGVAAGTSLAKAYKELETRRHGAGTIVLDWSDAKQVNI